MTFRQSVAWASADLFWRLGVGLFAAVTYSVILTNSPPPTGKSFGYTVESVAPCFCLHLTNTKLHRNKDACPNMFIGFSPWQHKCVEFYGHKSAYNSVTNER